VTGEASAAQGATPPPTSYEIHRSDSSSSCSSFSFVAAGGQVARGIGFSSEIEIFGAVLRRREDALREAAAGPEAHAAEIAERIRRWIADGARCAVTVGADFDPERVDDYDVVHDRDRGKAVALVQRDRLVEVVGDERALSAALDHAKQKGWLAPNLETGAVTRQKCFAGTDRKLRFVYFRRPFLGIVKPKRG
jgi:hypothetical protein